MYSQSMEHIKTFLNKCNIMINTYDDLNGMLIPREIFLDKEIYKSIKEDIAILKQIFASSSLTALQSTAEENQKWPLLNLVRQILKSCNYKMTPKRISDGYTKDGKKIYKRMFIIEYITQTLSVDTIVSSESSSPLIDDKSSTIVGSPSSSNN